MPSAHDLRVFSLLVPGLFFITSVFALHIVTNVITGTASFGTVNEEVSVLYNITINNTDQGLTANITHVNITLPANFSFTSGTIGTSFSYVSLTESSSLISFANISGLVLNASWGQIWFNATGVLPGYIFNISVGTTNSSGSQRQNLSVTINDTTSPTVVFSAPGLTSHANLSRNAVAINVSVSDESSPGIINVTLYSSTSSSAINSSNGTYGAASFFVNFTNVSDGVYFVNVTVNDSWTNINTTITPLRVVLDHAAPSVSLARSSGNKTSLNISITISDTLTGSGGACSIVSGGGSISGTGTTQYLFRNGLDCGEDNTFNVSCSDSASNIGYGFGTIATDGCASEDSGGGGSSGGSTTSTTYWDRTISVSSNDLGKGYSTILQQRERLRVSVGGLDHHVGLVDIDSDDVTINVSSTPQQAVLKINASRQFEVSGDSYYDLIVVVNDINSSASGANITVRAAHELTPAGAAALADSNSSMQNSSSNEGSSAALGALFSESSWWIWVVIALALIAGVLVAWKLYDRHQRAQGLRVSVEST